MHAHVRCLATPSIHTIIHTHSYARALADACPLLRRLDLSGNEITPDAVPAIAKAISKYVSLVSCVCVCCGCV